MCTRACSTRTRAQDTISGRKMHQGGTGAGQGRNMVKQGPGQAQSNCLQDSTSEKIDERHGTHPMPWPSLATYRCVQRALRKDKLAHDADA